MKRTEEIQHAFSGRRQSPPGTNGRVENSARKPRKRSSRAALLMGLGIILAGLLILVMAISGGLQDGAQPSDQGATEGGICDVISAQIADLIGTWEGTSAHISVEGGGDSYTLTSGRIVLILRCLQSGVSLDEIIEAQDNIKDRALIDLGEPSRPIAMALPGPVIDVTELGGELPPPPGLPQPERVGETPVAFGFAIDDDWVSASYTRGTNDKGRVTFIHQEALEWFRQRLASQHGTPRVCFQ